MMLMIIITIMDRFGTVRTMMKNGDCLDTVRALHETVVSLRTALEKSRNEINELKTKTNAFDYCSVENVIQSLTIENHVLRQKIIDDKNNNNNKHNNVININNDHSDHIKCVPVDQNLQEGSSIRVLGANKILPKEGTKKISRSLENLQSSNRRCEEKGANRKFCNISKTVSFSNFREKVPEKNCYYYYFAENMSYDVSDNNTKTGENRSLEKNDSVENAELEQDQEVDEVELIFTTDDTKEHDFKEALVSIDENLRNNDEDEDEIGVGIGVGGGSSQLLQCPTSDFEHSRESNLSCELDDDVFNDDNQIDARTDGGGDHLRKKSNESINRDDEKSLKSYYSLQDSSFENKSLEKDESFDRFDEKIRIIETDISKIGIQDVEYMSLGRRNTCPNPLQYRPISHRDTLNRGIGNRKSRPILAHSNAIRKESAAQTDISALPSTSSWRSESSLAHKVKGSENFATLPSKFPLPGSRLRLSDKTVEARRVLLSDIGFTSMVPELSRSADHICPPNLLKPPTTSFGQFLRTPDLYSPGFASQRFTWATTTTGSPSECSRTQSRYGSMYPLTSMSPLMSQTRRCSAPVSPSRRSNATLLKSTASNKVKFANGSLPELRTEWTTIDSSGGDSTDSLVDEAENYLRRSIECIGEKDYYYTRNIDNCKGAGRRASAPEAARDNVPPQGWQPFLPRLPRDLRLDFWVKVITSEGRVRGGRVRYVGPLASAQNEQYVGVQLSTPDGQSDGTFNNKRYFNCEAYHGIFVPFKKVVMGWRP